MQKVGKLAHALADALDETEGFVGLFLPAEFHSIRALLERTEQEKGDRDFHIWPRSRGVILGASDPVIASPGEPPAKLSANEPINIQIVRTDEADAPSPKEVQRKALHDAWSTAPSVARIIKALGRAAHSYRPKPSGVKAAALVCCPVLN